MALAAIMEKIDLIDGELARLLGLRFELSRNIGALKARSGDAPFDPVRICEQSGRFANACEAVGVDRWLATQLVSAIIGQVIVERFAAMKAPKPSVP